MSRAENLALALNAARWGPRMFLVRSIDGSRPRVYSIDPKEVNMSTELPGLQRRRPQAWWIIVHQQRIGASALGETVQEAYNLLERLRTDAQVRVM